MIPIKVITVSSEYNYDNVLTAVGENNIPELAEWHVYGNEQQGRFLTIYPYRTYLNSNNYYTQIIRYGEKPSLDIQNGIFSRQLGNKAYELKDHLGNVRVTFSDVKLPVPTVANMFGVDLLSKSEYYPYGMKINDLSYNATGVRYGYNSQEQSTELNLDGNHTTAEFWEYDARSARRWNNDPRPVTAISPYATFQGNPIMFSDIRGDSVFVYGGRTDPGASQENVLIDLNTEGISNGLEYSLNGSRLLSNRQDVIGPIDEKFQIFEDAINDASTNVNLFAGDFRNIIDLNGELGTVTLGAFKGNILSENGTREAFQFLNTDDLKLLIKEGVVNRGEVVLHELLESYLGATTYLNSSDQFIESHKSVLKIHGSTEFLTKYAWELVPMGLSNYYEDTYYGYNTLNPNNLVPLHKYIPGTKRTFYEMQTILDVWIIQRK